MAIEIINVVDPFVAFTITVNLVVAHTMWVPQLDPCFKGLQCVMKYASWNKIKAIVEEYVKHIFIPHFVKVSKHLN